jgi:hypothetical protein
MNDEQLKQKIEAIGFHDGQGKAFHLREPDMHKLMALFAQYAEEREAKARINERFELLWDVKRYFTGGYHARMLIDGFVDPRLAKVEEQLARLKEKQ